VVKRSRQLLTDVGSKIFGVVLNNVSIQSQDYYYYQRYYSTRNYKTDVDEETMTPPTAPGASNASAGNTLGL
jgi:hypothetical protein